MRAFVAIPIEGEIRQGLNRLLSDLKREFPGCRWVAPANLHVTLRFFGEIPNVCLAAVINYVEKGLAGAKPEPIRLGGIGQFRNRDRLVFWIGLEDAAWMSEAAGQLSGAIAGIPAEDRPFRPHLTLGRLRVFRDDMKQAGRIEERVKDGLPLPGKQKTVRSVLYRSHLSKAGARYEELWSKELGV